MAGVIALSTNASGQSRLADSPASIAVAPLAATVAVGSTAQFTVSSSINDAVAVIWKVNEIDGGDDAIGRISRAGLYRAPKELPDTATVKVTAISVANDKIKASAFITIVASSCYKDGPPCARIEYADGRAIPTSSVLVQGGGEIQLAAKTVNFSDSRLSWSINDDPHGNEAVGLIKAEGNSVTYKAPPSAPSQSVVIKASAQSNSDVSATTQIIVTAPRIFERCFSPKVRSSSGCTVKDFDRLEGETGKISQKIVDDRTDAGEVSAINSSKTIFSGSVLSIELRAGANSLNCQNYDWKLVVQAEESTNIFIYNPADMGSGVCEGNRFIIALPVHVLWADVFGFQQHLDPSRTPPSKPSSYSDCLGQGAPQTIFPCDKGAFWFSPLLYRFGWFYRHLTPPGTAQGTISLSPVIGQGQRQFSFDLQADPSYKVGLGWINIPLIFEKSTATGSNLDALILGVAYDFRWLRHPNVSEHRSFVVRKPQFQIRSGPEISPTTPHDLNLVESELVRLPLVFNFHEQPSALTIYPVVGLEEGSHFVTHLDETNPILRGVAGVDGSLRWPFNWTHNFLGSSPITLDYSYRIRWLAYDEPMTDVADNASEELSRQRRSFFRCSLIAPLNTNMQFQTTVLRGSLPPVFKIVTTTVSFGLTFTNPGSSEH